jgi:hypothetical protein
MFTISFTIQTAAQIAEARGYETVANLIENYQEVGRVF